jgi:thiamine pyrophosphate-dependent acetolactate synthase large subunit-like protein
VYTSDQELTLLLARAFDRAWARYYRPGRVTIPADVARPELAKYLVQVAGEGTQEEGALAAAGLLHLISLTPDLPDKSVDPV